MPPVGFEPTISAGERPQTYALGYDYIGARTDTTQQSGLTPDKEVEIKNITVYVSRYTETDATGMLSPPTVCAFIVAADINSNEYKTRHHKDRYIVRTDAHTTYSHIPEYDEACTPISSNCTSTVIDP